MQNLPRHPLDHIRIRVKLKGEGQTLDPHIKQRDIHFSTFHPDDNQAVAAMRLLGGMPGIENLSVHSPLRLSVRYHLAHFTLAEIEALLQELGFHLDNSLLVKLTRALFHYSDETERANLGCYHGQCKTTRDVFINRYQQRPHGCRDTRPPHWRNYL